MGSLYVVDDFIPRYLRVHGKLIRGVYGLFFTPLKILTQIRAKVRSKQR